MADDEHESGLSRRAVLAAGAVIAANALLGCDDLAPVTTDPMSEEDTAGDAESRDGQLDPDRGTGEPEDAEPPPDSAADTEPTPDQGAPDVSVDAAPTGPALDSSADAAPLDAAAEPDAEPAPDPVAWVEAVPPSNEFPLGIASGDATSDGAILWTQYTGPATLALVVWRPGVIQGIYAAEAAAAGFVHVELADLEAGARYRYAFVEYVDDAPSGRSEVGRFRAALAADARGPVVFGAISCTNQLFNLAPVGRAAGHEFDLFLLLGDTTYADGATTAADYRGKWAENFAGAPYRALRRQTSVLATWDDHEVRNNWNPEDTEPALVATARAAFFEHLPLRRDPGHPHRIWRSFRWGQTAEFFVLDSRGERRPSTRSGPEAEYLSPAQFDWLVAGLRDSPAVFKIVLNSVPIGEFPYPSTSDRWIGYPAQREALLSAITLEEIEGVVFISGDFHNASAGRVAAEGPGAQVPEFLVGPGGQIPNPLHLALPALPQFDWATGVNNYARFTLDPVRRALSVTYHSATDRLLYEATYAL